MRRFFILYWAVMLVSCNLPVSEQATDIPQATSPQVLPTQTSIPTLIATESPVPSTPTAAPLPCDPSSAEYCISSGTFIFQRPILRPYNDVTDISYLYASTQNGKRDPHHGVEFQNEFGTPVHAAGDGTVVFADADQTVKFSPWTNFYGNVVIVQHADDLYTLYAHLSAIKVQVGDEVKAGSEIGQVGQTGGATGPHLHFEVRRGGDYTDHFSTENPELWMLPPQGTGALSITLLTDETRNQERPLVLTRFAEGSDIAVFTYYLTTYTRGFEHHAEDAVLGNLPPGRYKLAFSHFTGLKERLFLVEAGKLTEVVFDLK